ncbi:MAG: MBL fold metallo-hydrolase [Alphaproteobacteria bacterium]|nr:MBL fold metallo-hydrolase [Alphaproteobacteria bacterium]
MNHPTQLPGRRVGPDTDMLSAYVPLPGLGVLPINAFLIRAREPVLLDTGMAALRDDFMEALRDLIDPAALRWIWVTHADADHVGNLRAVLEAAPQARFVTNYLGIGKLGLQMLPLERSHMIHPGQTLHVGDRDLLALRPPVYDAPETMAAFDSHSGTLFSSDCFGAVMQRPAESAAAIAPAALQDGLSLWATIDAPWLAQTGRAQLAAAVRPLRDLEPRQILGSHLPPAAGIDDRLFAGLEAALTAPIFNGPVPRALRETVEAGEPVVA